MFFFTCIDYKLIDDKSHLLFTFLSTEPCKVYLINAQINEFALNKPTVINYFIHNFYNIIFWMLQVLSIIHNLNYSKLPITYNNE